jgi:hypothetical protein
MLDRFLVTEWRIFVRGITSKSQLGVNCYDLTGARLPLLYQKHISEVGIIGV